MTRRSRVLAAAALVASVVALGAWAWHVRGPAPPRLADLGALDPDASRLLADAVASVNGSRRDPAQWGRLAMIAEANGLVGAARGAYEHAAALASADARWWYHTARMRARLGADTAAIDAMRRAIALDGGYAPARWRLGLWLLDRGDLDGAGAAFTEAMRLDPSDVGGWAGLARVALARNDPQHAADVLERWLGAHPGDRYALYLLGTAYRRLGRAEEAQFALAVGNGSELAAADPWTDGIAGFQRGFAPMLKDATARALAGRFDEAIPLLERLLARRPSDVPLRTHLGEVYVAAGRIADAQTLLDGVLAEHPDHVDAHLALGDTFARAGSLPRALAAVDRALALRPDFARAHDSRGRILRGLGRTAEALDAFEAAVRADPRDIEARVAAGYLALDLRQLPRAAASFEGVVRLAPAFADAWVGFALVRLAQGAPDEARTMIARAEQLDPQHPRLAAARAALERAVPSAGGLRRRTS